MRVSIVWTPMLAADTAAAAARAATLVVDTRARQYYDPARRAGQVIAAGLGGAGQVAWDIYLFYAPDTIWGAAAPPPVRYVHQLGDQWAAPAYRRHGAALVAALRETMQQVVPPGA